MSRNQKVQTQNTSIKPNPTDFYSKILISKTRRRVLSGLLLVLLIIFTFFILNQRRANRDWLSIAWPITFVGLMVSLFPQSEEWVYKPWQSRPRQYERHSIN